MKQFFSSSLLLSTFFWAAPPVLSMNINGTVHEAHCGQSNGAIEINVFGGTAPYTYLWSPVPAQGQGTTMISGLAPGDYTVTVTDALAVEASQMFTVTDNPDLLGFEYQYPAQDSHANCPGHCWGEFRVPESYLPGVAPYLYSEPIAGYDVLGEPYFYVPGGACGGDNYQITVTDNTGCSGVMNIVIIEPQVGSPAMAVTNITGSCTGGWHGTVTFANVYNGNFFTAPTMQLFDHNGFGWTELSNVGDNVTFTDLAPGHYHVLRNWNYFYQYTVAACDDDTLGFDIPDLGVACGTVSGMAFIDNDQNCAQDVNEPGIPELVLEVQPGPAYLITDASGHYLRDLVDGSYTLTQSDATLVQLCPVAVPVPFTIADDAQVIDLADSSTVPLDLQALMGNSPAHPGFSFQQVLKVKNLSPQVSGAITATLTFDAAITFSSATIVPTSVVGNTITWDLPALFAYGQYNFNVQFDVPAGTPLGTVLDQAFSVSNTLGEANLLNNALTSTITVVGSFDPNAKSVVTSTRWSEELYFIDQDQYMDYTIQFQNTGTDTAHTVVVTDTLSEVLDMGSFQQGIASHAYGLSFKPGRVVEWRFENILLPDEATNEAASHGLVSFRIRPMQPLLPGTIWSNNADIFFDFNDPIRTNDATLEAEFSTDVSHPSTGSGRQFVLAPNPAVDRLTVLGPNLAAFGWVIQGTDGRIAAEGRASTGSVDISMLRSGAYSLRVMTPEDAISIPFIKIDRP